MKGYVGRPAKGTGHKGAWLSPSDNTPRSLLSLVGNTIILTAEPPVAADNDPGETCRRGSARRHPSGRHAAAGEETTRPIHTSSSLLARVLSFIFSIFRSGYVRSVAKCSSLCYHFQRQPVLKDVNYGAKNEKSS